MENNTEKTSKIEDIAPSNTNGNTTQSSPKQSEKKGFAITAMVCGICGLVFPVFLAAVAGLVFGIIGLSKYKKGEAGGKGMSITGIVTGGIGVAFSIIFTIIMISFVGSVAGGIVTNYTYIRDNYNPEALENRYNESKAESDAEWEKSEQEWKDEMNKIEKEAQKDEEEWKKEYNEYKKEMQNKVQR